MMLPTINGELNLTMSKDTLITLLTKQVTSLVQIRGLLYIFEAVERESGSGDCFNVRVYNPRLKKKETLFVRLD